jgi:hypothetical protein
MIKLLVLSMTCVAFCSVSLGQDCKFSGTPAWNPTVHYVVPDCAADFASPSGRQVLKIAADGRMTINADNLHWDGPQLEAPAMVSWSPTSEAFFVNDGEGSGLSSLFRFFRVQGSTVSEDKKIGRAAVALFRQRMRCSPSSEDPNVWGFGWNPQGTEIYLLVQPIVNASCGRPDQIISLVVRTHDGAILEALSKKQTRARFGSILPATLFGK